MTSKEIGAAGLPSLHRFRFPKAGNVKNTFTSDSGYILTSVLMTGFLIISLLFGVFAVVAFNYQLDIRRFNKKKLDLALYSAAQKRLRNYLWNIFPGSQAPAVLRQNTE